MPCPDAITCQEMKSNNSYSDKNHDHSEDETDLCSPFCVCSCCGCSGFLLTIAKIYFKDEVKINTPFFVFFYRSEFISSYYYSFWQPPKIALS
ncbi:hypothetical protein SAMN04487930_106175 [Cytophaga hutchinsonii ATCC 33406]|nr:hypothetical protein SAMN04487930_106175 [Cytophaga hutchinsonii ATCC 33406]